MSKIDTEQITIAFNLYNNFKYILLSILLLTFFTSSCQDKKEETKLKKKKDPNIVIIFIDDEGYGDVGSYGATGFTTPNLDKMAAEGMRFTNFYSGSSICSPSRAALLTGCYPQRVGIPRVYFPEAKNGLNSEETILAELLKQKGYKTSIIGKWHLGHHEQFLPLQHGFDEFFGLPYSNDMWPVGFNGKPLTANSKAPEWKKNCRPLPLIRGNQKIEEITTLEQQNELTTRYTKEAVKFINKNSKSPFFLYIPHSMSHVPLGVSDKFRGKSEQGFYGDVMMELDWSVGRINEALKANGIEDNTIVIFTTDNGPWLRYGNHGGSNGGLKEGKISVFEGGFRVPCIIKWPQQVPKGVVNHQISSSIDIFPTIAKIIQTELPKNKIDGKNVLPYLKGTPVKPIREYFFYYDLEDLRAVRHKNWKYIYPHRYQSVVNGVVGKDGFPGKPKWIDFPGGLYNLRQDPGERVNLEDAHPDIVKMLKKEADIMRKKLGDKSLGIKGNEIRPAGKI